MQIENGKPLKKKLTNAIFFVIIVITFYTMAIVGMNFYKRSFSHLVDSALLITGYRLVQFQ